jgi:hypothetical protein
VTLRTPEKVLQAAKVSAKADSHPCTCGKPKWMHYNLLDCVYVPAKKGTSQQHNTVE